MTALCPLLCSSRLWPLINGRRACRVCRWLTYRCVCRCLFCGCCRRCLIGACCLLQAPVESPKHQKVDKVPSGLTGMAAVNTIGSSATLPSHSSSNSGAHSPANLPLGSVEAQLKYENDRLKLALAQRSVIHLTCSYICKTAQL